MVTRTSLVSLAGLRLYLPALADAAGPDHTAMILVGASMPYGRAEIQQQFGTTIAAEIDYAPVPRPCSARVRRCRAATPARPTFAG